MDKPEIMRKELLPETTLCDGKYVIEKIIGSGGFGITYLARHAVIDRKYAIKEFFLQAYNVRNSVTNSVGLQGMESGKYNHFRKCFIDEAKTLASLSHDGIVKVVDFFDENGTSYIVMPFVEGITLECIVERDGPMEYEMAVNYIMGICDALSYIHSKNILHRDVTPGNIIVTPEQKTVLVDFGSARKFVDNEIQRHTTLVKHGYAPLEQYIEESKKGAYTDLYSLGGVFYYILTGVRPIDAAERTMTKMKEPIELNPKIPAQINAVIMKAMELKSENRYQSVGEFAKDILDGNFPAKQEEKVVQEEVTPSQNATELKQKKMKYVLIAFSLILLFAILYKVIEMVYTQVSDSQLVVSERGVFSMGSLFSESDEKKVATLEELYDVALNKMNSSDIDSLKEGLAVMDSLNNINYIPAIYQMAFTYGWYSDSISVNRKKMLGIAINEDFLPVSNKYTNMAVALFTRIMELNDSAYADINAMATYRLACYYVLPNNNYKIDMDKGKRLLLRSKEWATKAKNKKGLEDIKGLQEYIMLQITK